MQPEKTSNCSWDFGVIALQLGHHKAQQLQMHNYNLTRLQLEPCCNLETTEICAEEMYSASWRPATVGGYLGGTYTKQTLGKKIQKGTL